VHLPFPERIPLFYVLTFAVLLGMGQLLEGTAPEFSLYCVLYVILTGIAFNLAGGLRQTTGAYVLFYSVLTVIIGVSWKVVLGEPGESNLLVPLLSMRICLGGQISLLVAVFLSKKLRTKQPLLRNMVKQSQMRNAAYGALLVGTTIMVLLMVSLAINSVNGDSSVLSALNQLNRFLPLAIILGVTHKIRQSGGTSMLSMPALLAATIFFVAGVINFSKEGMFTPIVCWAIAAASQRYKLSLMQVAVAMMGAIFIGLFLVPYSQYGRIFKTQSFIENANTSANLLSDLGSVRQNYEEATDEVTKQQVVEYYNTPQGFIDRLNMLAMDDALFNETEQKGFFGFAPIPNGFINFIPHFLWPDKPTLFYGNLYARQIGYVIGEDDLYTGISFSPMGEAYHIEGWWGVFFIAPVLWIMLFALFDSLCGDTQEYPWGLIMILTYAHFAPESMLSGVIYLIGFGTAALLFAALTSAYVLPILGTLIVGPEKVVTRGMLNVRSHPRRVPDISVAQS
jgi:hypothetical protein